MVVVMGGLANGVETHGRASLHWASAIKKNPRNVSKHYADFYIKSVCDRLFHLFIIHVGNVVAISGR